MKMFKRLRYFLHAALIESLAIGLIAFIIVSNNSLPSAQSENSSPSITSSESRDVSTVWNWWNKGSLDDEGRGEQARAENRIGLLGYIFE